MSEKLSWEKREHRKSELAERLESLVNDVVVVELNDINSKIESLCTMGVLQNNDKLNELRERMKQLQPGKRNDCSK